MIRFFFLSSACLFLTYCGTSDSSLAGRALTAEQALEDFEELVRKIRAWYGPLNYKKNHPAVMLDFENWTKQHFTELEKVTTEAQIAGVFHKFIRGFRDAHFSVSFPMSDQHIRSYSIPIFVTPLIGQDGKWHVIVADVDSSWTDARIAKGDEVLKVDGKDIFDYLPLIQQYKSSGNDVTDKHYIFKVFSRDYFMTEMIPILESAEVVFQSNADQKVHTENFVWKKNFDDFGYHDLIRPYDSAMNESTFKQKGVVKPFFATDEVVKKYAWREVEPTKQSLKKFGISPPTDAAPLYAARFRFEQKNILLVRQPIYVPPIPAGKKGTEIDLIAEAAHIWVQTYKAVLWQNEDVDVLVIDQTHNPGGLSQYVLDFFRIFISEQAKNIVQLNRADRRWMQTYLGEYQRLKEGGKPLEAERQKAWALAMERAMEEGANLSDPLPFDYDFTLEPHKDFQWKKPVLVLTDELSASCGDIFPLLVKHNNTGRIFGQRTMGAGGNVEETDLTHSRASVRLTRGLFTIYQGSKNREDYDPALNVENNGVVPDQIYEHTVEDFRDGYVRYVERFATFGVTK